MKPRDLTIAGAVKSAALRLQSRKEAQILMAHHLGSDRIRVMTRDHESLKNPGAYFALVARREAGEPIEYITGQVSFYSRTFHIAPGALIPRPETELLIDEAATVLRSETIARIAEIGTGSGVIAVMLALIFPNLQIVATDINPDALKIARINTQKFGVADRIVFHETSLLDTINENFDMIISNPPYIAEGAVLEKPLSYEPQNALFGGEKGDELLRKIIELALERDTKWLLCETGYDQEAPLSRYLRQKGIRQFRFYRDYAGLNRGFVAKLKE